MAVVIPRLSQLAFRWHGLRTVPAVKRQGFVCWQCRRQKERRTFHSSPIWQKDEDEIHENEGGNQARSASDFFGTKEYQFHLSELEPSERAHYESLSPSDQKTYRTERKTIHDILTSPQVDAEFQAMVSQAVAEAERDAPHFEIEHKPVRNGFWNMGEAEREDSGEDEEYEGDDLNELGHAELEQHREMREYARIAAWEMPLLSKLATPFQPPDMSHPLRFRYTTYMGEVHPAAKKIVLEFSPADLPGLTEAQRTKLIKLVGPRYNPETDIVKMSSEMFETQAQNKRYLGDLVDTLMAEAKDGGDMFEDVPLDFRHHRFKKKVEFPEEWKLTPERRRVLEEARRKRGDDEQGRVSEGRVVDGGEILREAMAMMPIRGDSRLLADQQRGGKKGGARQMLR